MIYGLHIELTELESCKVYRDVIVPSSLTFDQLHRVIQIVFGWDDYHLYEFTERNPVTEEETLRISVPSTDDEEYYDIKTTNSRTTRISKIFAKKDSMVYIYDFGDYWLFEISVIDRIRKNIEAPFCIAGEGATPPEDCGGTGGYEEMLRSLKENDDEAESYREWIGLNANEQWNPTEFSFMTRKAVNHELFTVFALSK